MKKIFLLLALSLILFGCGKGKITPATTKTTTKTTTESLNETDYSIKGEKLVGIILNDSYATYPITKKKCVLLFENDKCTKASYTLDFESLNDAKSFYSSNTANKDVYANLSIKDKEVMVDSLLDLNIGMSYDNSKTVLQQDGYSIIDK